MPKKSYDFPTRFNVGDVISIEEPCGTVSYVVTGRGCEDTVDAVSRYYGHYSFFANLKQEQLKKAEVVGNIKNKRTLREIMLRNSEKTGSGYIMELTHKALPEVDFHLKPASEMPKSGQRIY